MNVKDKRAIMWIVIGIVAFLATASVAYIAIEAVREKGRETAITREDAISKETMRKAMVMGCMDKDTSDNSKMLAYCECCSDYIVENYTYDEMLRTLDDKTFEQQVLLNAVSKCYMKL